MALITIKGHQFQAILARDGFARRAMLYKNNIVTALGKIGIPPDDVVLDLEPRMIQNLPASVTWYADGYRMYYSCKSAKKYVDNLYIISKLIEHEVADLLSGKKSFEDFITDFAEDKDVDHSRKAAREVLGLEEDVQDIAQIDNAYKVLAKRHHPDMESGDPELFKKINIAHKVLRRELC